MHKFFLIVLMFFALNINAQELSVLTYNIKYDNPSDTINGWENRKDFLISQLNYNQPDIFGTQEGLYNQLNDIKNGMDNYSFFGVGRDDGNIKGEFTAIFYNTKKLKLLKENTFWLSETTVIPSKGWDAAYKRVCTYGLFEIQKTGKQFLIFNTHFDNEGVQARKESSLLILKKIEELNTLNLPVILMGDFNLESDSEGVQKILNYMEDSHVIANMKFGPQGTFNGFHFEKSVKKRIDFIFVSKNMKVFKSGILSDSKDCHYPSDHFPVYVELNFNYE